MTLEQKIARAQELVGEVIDAVQKEPYGKRPKGLISELFVTYHKLEILEDMLSD